VQPAAGKATGGHPAATDAEVEGRTGLAHQVAAAHEEQRQRDRVLDRRADRREQRSRVPAPSIPVVDPYPDVPTGQVAEADIDVDPARADLEPGRLDRRLAPLPQLTTHLDVCGIQGQARLPIDVEASVMAPLEQDDHPPAVDGAVEHLKLQTLVVGVVGDLEVEHPVDGPHLQVEGAQHRLAPSPLVQLVGPERFVPDASRRNHLRWGATDEEIRRAMPGDDLIPDAASTTRAITIAAPAEQV
jgi:hypothetical protein